MVGIDPKFSNFEARLPKRELWESRGKVQKERLKTKILHKVKGTGACRCSKNNGKLVIVVCTTDVTCLQTQTAVRAAVAMMHSDTQSLK